MRTKPQTQRSSKVSVEITLLLTAVALVAGLSVMRYGGLWGETDTNVFASVIRAMLNEERLVPEQAAYSNGYGFQTLSVSFLHLTGLSVTYFQIFGAAFLTILLVVPAWLAYRELVGSVKGATLATALIFIQPDFLFPILRGTHEKFTRGFMFLALFLLIRSLSSRGQWQRFSSYLLTFYLTIYAMITFNNLLAISFITALALSIGLNIFVRWLSGEQTPESLATGRRLGYATVVALILAFLFTFYAYAPARSAIFIVDSMVDRVLLLFLDLESTSSNPYQVVTTGWISFPIYVMVSLATWLLLFLSFILWGIQTYRWWRNQSWPTNSHRFLLWSFYTSFGFLGALSILVDVSGAIASNLQHRVFPTFAMMATAMVADWFIRTQKDLVLSRYIAYVGLVVGIVFLSFMSVMKATNEPSLSNKWVYYTRTEFAALDWSRTAYPDGATWTSFDERLRAAIGICCNWEAEGIQLDSFEPDLGTRNYLISETIRARAERLGLPLPIEGDSLRVYDNGSAEIYHLRPRTPFQK